MTTSAFTTKKVAIGGLLVALSVLGSYISVPIPGLGSTIAFDSLPGFFGALYLSPALGALIGAIGHLVTALIHGFPQGLPNHILVMLFMGVACGAFGLIYHRQKILAIITALFINSPLTLFLASVLSFQLGMTPTMMFLFYLLVVPLSIVALANILFAAGLYEGIGRRIR